MIDNIPKQLKKKNQLYTILHVKLQARKKSIFVHKVLPIILPTLQTRGRQRHEFQNNLECMKIALYKNKLTICATIIP